MSTQAREQLAEVLSAIAAIPPGGGREQHEAAHALTLARENAIARVIAEVAAERHPELYAARALIRTIAADILAARAVALRGGSERARLASQMPGAGVIQNGIHPTAEDIASATEKWRAFEERLATSADARIDE